MPKPRSARPSLLLKKAAAEDSDDSWGAISAGDSSDDEKPTANDALQGAVNDAFAEEKLNNERADLMRKSILLQQDLLKDVRPKDNKNTTASKKNAKAPSQGDAVMHALFQRGETKEGVNKKAVRKKSGGTSLAMSRLLGAQGSSTGPDGWSCDMDQNSSSQNLSAKEQGYVSSAAQTLPQWPLTAVTASHPHTAAHPLPRPFLLRTRW